MSTSTIDPRIRARRVEVQKTEGRKRLRRLAWTAGVLGFVSLLVLAATSPLLDVDRVAVTGADRTGSAAVAEAGSVEAGDRMVTLPLDAVAERIARLPWVDTAEVTRRWPGTVAVEITERVPIAAVPAVGGGFLLLDHTARQLAVERDLPPGVLRVDIDPVTARPGRDLPAGRGALVVATTVPEVLRESVLSLAAGGRDQLDAVVRIRDGGQARVRLCSPERIEAKWLALVALLAEVEPPRLGSIDVCVPDAPLVTRR